MNSSRQEVIKWLSENTTREQWLNKETVLFYKSPLQGWRTQPKRSLCHTPDTNAKVYAVSGVAGVMYITFEDVFCVVDQPTFIDEGIYELHCDGAVLSKSRYDKSLNRFSGVGDQSLWVGGSEVGVGKQFTPILVSKGHFETKCDISFSTDRGDTFHDLNGDTTIQGFTSSIPWSTWQMKKEIKPPTAQTILGQASENIGNRASERDAESEKSMTACVKAFNALYSKDLTEEEGWMFQVLLKASRAKGGDYREDDYVDGASYFGLAGECAFHERK